MADSGLVVARSGSVSEAIPNRARTRKISGGSSSVVEAGSGSEGRSGSTPVAAAAAVWAGGGSGSEVGKSSGMAESSPMRIVEARAVLGWVVVTNTVPRWVGVVGVGPATGLLDPGGGGLRLWAVVGATRLLDPGGKGGAVQGGWFRGGEPKFTMLAAWKLLWPRSMEEYGKEAMRGDLDWGLGVVDVDVGLEQVNKSKRKRAASDMPEGCSDSDGVGVEFPGPTMG